MAEINTAVDPDFHVVQEDEYLFMLAERFGTTVPQLVIWNMERFPSLAVNRDLIYPGWRLRVG